MARVFSFPRILASLLAFILLSCAPFPSMAAQQAGSGEKLAGIKIPATIAYVGTLTSKERNGKGKGLEVVSIGTDGKWTPLQTVEVGNPSFLTMDSKKRFLYSCQSDGTDVVAYAIDQKTGKLTKLNEKQASGKNGIHLVVSHDDRFLVVGCYADGLIDTFALNADGSLGDKVCTVSTKGEGGPYKYQTKSMPHHVAFSKDGRFLLVSDKGRDMIHVYVFDAKTGQLTPHDPAAMTSRRAMGTRRFDWHPTQAFAYILEESADDITVATWDAEKGILYPIQWIPSVPDNYFPRGRNDSTQGRGSSEIFVAKSGKFVYATNRSDNSIGAFAIDQKTGRIKPLGWTKSGGDMPRFFTFDPSHKAIFAANQLSDNIVGFTVNQDTGELTTVGTVFETGSPVCIIFK